MKDNTDFAKIRAVLRTTYIPLEGDFMRMSNSEMRLEGEEFGYFVFAFLPKKCRNGKWRWLCWLERHGEKGSYTYTLGTRAK